MYLDHVDHVVAKKKTATKKKGKKAKSSDDESEGSDSEATTKSKKQKGSKKAGKKAKKGKEETKAQEAKPQPATTSNGDKKESGAYSRRATRNSPAVTIFHMGVAGRSSELTSLLQWFCHRIIHRHFAHVHHFLLPRAVPETVVAVKSGSQKNGSAPVTGKRAREEEAPAAVCSLPLSCRVWLPWLFAVHVGIRVISLALMYGLMTRV